MSSDTEQMCIFKSSFMSASNSEIFVDHASNLSSTEKSVLHLGLLLLQTDILLEVRRS